MSWPSAEQKLVLAILPTEPRQTEQRCSQQSRDKLLLAAAEQLIYAERYFRTRQGIFWLQRKLHMHIDIKNLKCLWLDHIQLYIKLYIQGRIVSQLSK